MNNTATINELAGKHLGQKGGEGYKETYDASLLVAIPRHLNREAYSIDSSQLPFVGVDIWNAYEVSAITTKGQPVSGVLKIVYPANSEFHVESKSIKLYLNSLNMTPMGKTAEECKTIIENLVARDLSDILHTNVETYLFTSVKQHGYGFENFTPIDKLCDLDKITFTCFKSDAKQLEAVTLDKVETIHWRSDLLRSNCRVTNQPDWGDIFITMKGTRIPTPKSLAKYIVSHRQVSHFHEEIVEMVYMHLKEAFNPEELMVCALYTRRGGIDICPLRASNAKLIPVWFKDPVFRLEKTSRQ